MPGFTPRYLPDEEATLTLGQQLARSILSSGLGASGLVFALLGDLGAGKTTLVRGVLRGLGYTGRVKSPTYPLLETYQVGDLALSHFDLYRLESPEAFSEAGFEDYFVGPGVRFVEWPDRAADRLPPVDCTLSLTETANGGRQIAIDALTPLGETLLVHLMSGDSA